AQLKTAVTAQGFMRPIAPPVYRPQPLPKVLQTKKAVDYNPHAHQALRKPPVAPPVYRPQPTPAVLQRKAAVLQRIPAQQVAKSRTPEPVRRQIGGAPHRFPNNVLQRYKEPDQQAGG